MNLLRHLRSGWKKRPRLCAKRVGLTRDNSFSQVNGVSGAACITVGVLHRNMNTIMLPKQFHINALNFNKNIVISASQN
jgi:hypothetical protein